MLALDLVLRMPPLLGLLLLLLLGVNRSVLAPASPPALRSASMCRLASPHVRGHPAVRGATFL